MIACGQCVAEDAAAISTETIEDGFAVKRVYRCVCGSSFTTMEVSETILNAFGRRNVQIQMQAHKRGAEARALAGARRKRVENLMRHGLKTNAIALELNITPQGVSHIKKEIERERAL